MSTEFNIELREFHQFLSEKLSTENIVLSPEEALDEWRSTHSSQDDFGNDVAAVREALADMANGDVGAPLTEFDRNFRDRHGLSK